MEIIVRISKQEMWNLGFEKVEYNGKTYVDVAPLLLDSTCPLSLAYHELVEKKIRKLKREDARKRKNLKRKKG